MKNRFMKLYRGLLSIGVTLAFVFSITGNFAYATDLKLYRQKQLFESRVQTLINIKISEMEEQYKLFYPDSPDINLSVVEVKKVEDFAGNTYSLYECEPSGYILFHEESGIFVEYSATAPSPYMGLYDQLFYIGPGEYFSQQLSENGADYHHTVQNKTISKHDSEIFAEASIDMNEKLVKEQNYKLTSYLKGEISDLSQVIDASFDVSGVGASSQKTAVGVTSVSKTKIIRNANFFINMRKCGVNNSGTCGYLAAGMLLAYQQSTYGGNYVSKRNLTYECEGKNCYANINDALHRELVGIGAKLGYGNSTTSREIRFTVNKYLNDRGITVNYVDEWAPIANNVKITSYLDKDRPVIWFGQIITNSADNRTWLPHAVVVYAYERSIFNTYGYIAHFGWNGDNVVSFTGILGSMYTFTT